MYWWAGKVSKPVTTVQECVSSSVSMKPQIVAVVIIGWHDTTGYS